MIIDGASDCIYRVKIDYIFIMPLIEWSGYIVFVLFVYLSLCYLQFV